MLVLSLDHSLNIGSRINPHYRFISLVELGTITPTRIYAWTIGRIRERGGNSLDGVVGDEEHNERAGVA
jgi:hypothetical protein